MRGKSLDEATILRLFKQMISAVDFVHSRKIFHRDIKPENILLDPQCNSKLCDFGFSAIFGDGQNRQTLCGTKDYLAPEVIMSHNQNDKVDIWCMGVLLYELIHKRPPFIGKNIIVLLEDIKSSKIKFLQNINHEFRKIIEWCLKLDPNQRPSARVLIESFPILRENSEQPKDYSNTETPPSEQPGSFLKKNSERSNVNINIGAVNINFFNQETPAVDSNRDYFNVYMPSERPKEMKHPKASLPEKITSSDFGKFKYSVNNTNETLNDHSENDELRIMKKFSENSTNPTNKQSESQRFIAHPSFNNTPRVVNSMIEQKTETNKYSAHLKMPYSMNPSQREKMQKEEQRESKFSESSGLNCSPTPKGTNFFDLNDNVKSAHQPNAQSLTFSHPKITSYSPAPTRRDFQQFPNVTVTNFVNIAPVNTTIQRSVIDNCKGSIEVVHSKMSISMNDKSPQRVSSSTNNNSLSEQNFNAQFQYKPQSQHRTQPVYQSQPQSFKQILPNQQYQPQEYTSQSQWFTNQSEGYRQQAVQPKSQQMLQQPSQQVSYQQPSQQVSYQKPLQQQSQQPSQQPPLKPSPQLFPQQSLQPKPQLHNPHQQLHARTNRPPSKKEELPMSNNFNWKTAQNIRDPNVQLVNIYKKDLSEPQISHTNIYKNINRNYSPKTDFVEKKEFDKTPVFKNSIHYGDNSFGNNVPHLERSGNSVSRTVTYSVQQDDKKNNFSSSVPRKVENSFVDGGKLLKIGEFSQQKFMVSQNAQTGAPNRERVVRSNSAQISDPRRIRYSNI